MEEEEIHKIIEELADICLEAIEKDLGEPIDLTRLVINDVSYDTESSSLNIDWDYEN